jgi:hypothetical protein
LMCAGNNFQLRRPAITHVKRTDKPSRKIHLKHLVISRLAKGTVKVWKPIFPAIDSTIRFVGTDNCNTVVSKQHF